MKFTVDRSKWRFGLVSDQGDGKGPTFLLNPQGYMCCLGFCMKQLGCTDDDIRHYGSPHEVTDEETPFTSITEEDTKIEDTYLSIDAIVINDDEGISNEARERKLSRLFQTHGHEIEFVGDYSAASNTAKS